MTWSKVFILDRIAGWGLNLVISDLDVVWFRDPSALLDQYPAAGARHLRLCAAWPSCRTGCLVFGAMCP